VVRGDAGERHCTFVLRVCERERDRAGKERERKRGGGGEEKEIAPSQASIERILADGSRRTTIIIAHRLSTVPSPPLSVVSPTSLLHRRLCCRP
jgi:hypothetical protein